MQVYPNKFYQHINSHNLPPFFLIFGDEPQQKMECVDAVRVKVKKEGFEERQSFTADSEFSWSQLVDATQSMSLFSDRQYIELTLPTGKPGAEGAKVLTALAGSTNTDVLILIQGPKIGKDVQQAKWFKSLNKDAIFCHCYALEGQALIKWIQYKCHEFELPLSASGVKLLADFCEGNLLAAKQEIEKLVLQFPNTNVSDEQLANAIVDQSRFNVFQLVDELLSGNIQKAIKMLYRLESEGIEPNIVLWSLIREAQTLSKCIDLIQSGQPLNFNKLGIWNNKQGIYQNAIARLNGADINLMLRRLHQADVILKSESVARPFILIAHLCLLFMPAPLEQIELN